MTLKIIATIIIFTTAASAVALSKSLITKTEHISLLMASQDKNTSGNLLKKEKNDILALINHDKKIPKKTTKIATKRKTKSKSKVISTAKRYLGTRYRYGASSKTTKCFDCSSFTQRVYKSHGKKLPRTSRNQSKIGKRVSKKNLRPGDLLFFSTRRTKGVGHVGIYLGGNKFIHASSTKKKIIISSLSKKYYKSHYKWARRI